MVAVQLVAEVRGETDPKTRWLSISGSHAGGFLIRCHRAEDARTHFDAWASSLEDAMAYGDAYGISHHDWHRPDIWVNGSPPGGYQEQREVQWIGLEHRRLTGEISRSDAIKLALDLIVQTAGEIADRTLDPLQGSLDIYSIDWFGGGWDDDQPAAELQHWGAEFIQLHDELERYLDNLEERQRWAAVTREAAAAGLAGRDSHAGPSNRRLGALISLIR